VTNKFLLSADIKAAAQAGTITQEEADTILLRLNATDWDEAVNRIPDELMDKIKQGAQKMSQEEVEAEGENAKWKQDYY
jgi:hypothetical protein